MTAGGRSKEVQANLLIQSDSWIVGYFDIKTLRIIIELSNPIPSIHGISAYIYHKNKTKCR